MNIDAYRTVSLDSTPRQLWPALAYTTVLRLIGTAQTAIARGDPKAAHEDLMRAQQIIIMLRNSLNKDAGGDLALNLEQLYDYILRELQGANIAKDAGRLAALVPIIAPLRDAWEEAGRSVLRSSNGRARQVGAT